MRNKFSLAKILLKIGTIGLFSTIMFTGCGEVQFQSKIYTTHQIIKDKQSKEKQKQTKYGVTIEDKGEAKNLSTPIRLQSCSNGQLQTKRVKKCSGYGDRQRCFYEEIPLFVNANALNGIYFRKIKIHNNTDHILYLNRTDVVLIDGAGGEHECAKQS